MTRPRLADRLVIMIRARAPSVANREFNPVLGATEWECPYRLLIGTPPLPFFSSLQPGPKTCSQ